MPVDLSSLTVFASVLSGTAGVLVGKAWDQRAKRQETREDRNAQIATKEIEAQSEFREQLQKMLETSHQREEASLQREQQLHTLTLTQATQLVQNAEELKEQRGMIDSYAGQILHLQENEQRCLHRTAELENKVMQLEALLPASMLGQIPPGGI